MTEINKFRALFHSIQGETYKEKQRNFNQFLHSLKMSISNVQDIDELIKSIAPKNRVEEIFKIEIMIALKRQDLLLDELKTCNRFFVHRLLKDWRLYGELFNNVSAKELINDILPHLSYSLRLKVLNGVSKNVTNEKLLDDYFNALQRKYGLNSAALVLPGCSMDLIKSIIEKYHLKLPQSHLKRIFKRDQQFAGFYFTVLEQKYKDINFTTEYCNVLKYMANVNPSIYWELHDKFKLRVRFGKYLTPKMIKSHKNIIEQGLTTFDTFHNLKMYETLKEEDKYEQFLLSFYPETHDKFTEAVLNSKILSFLVRGSYFKDYNLISSYFTRKYDKSLLDYPDYYTENFLKMTPTEERVKILDYKVKENERLYYLYPTAISVPKIKQQIQHSSNAKSREELSIALIDTCFANNDKIALLEVLRFILNRYKNDTKLMKSVFDKITWTPEYSRRLNREHSACLFSILKVLNASNLCVWCNETFLVDYIGQMLADHLSIDEVIHRELKKVIDNPMRTFVSLSRSYKQYEREYCDEVVKCLDSYKDHEKYEALCNRFLYILSHTALGKEDILNYKRFFHVLRADNSWEIWDIVSKMMKWDDEILHNYFWTSESVISNAVLLWYARHRPDLLRDNALKIWKLLSERNVARLFEQFKQFCDEDTIKKITSNALELVHEDYEKSKFPIQAISVFVPETFMDMIATAYPEPDGKIDLDESQDKINIRRTLINSLKYIEDPAKSLPLVLKFCIGDYLKFTLSSLYSVAYNTKESSINDSLSPLSKTAVSVRKHLLFLGRHLFTTEDFSAMLKDSSEREKNLSLRNIILRKTMEYFVENPSEDLWILLKSNLNNFDSEDRDIYDFLLKFQRIPLAYVPEYFELIYNVISKNGDIKVSQKKFDLVDAIPTEVIGKFSEKFLRELIAETVFSDRGRKFSWKCVFHSDKSMQARLFEENFKQLVGYVQRDTSGFQNRTVRCGISDFLKNFLDLILELKKSNGFVEKFKSAWLSIFEPGTFGKEFIGLECVDLYFKSGFDNFDTGRAVNELFYQYITTRHNVSVIDSFCREVHSFLLMSGIAGKEKDLLAFVNGFFQEKKDENIYVAVIDFLPKKLPAIDNAYAKYLPIFEAVENCQLPVVRYHLDLYLGNLGL